MSKTEAELERIAAPVCEKHGVYIYASEYKKEGGDYFLRLFIDKDGGVSIDDCERVSREISPLLDTQLDFLKEAYIFEVSSPGIERSLTREWHFDKAVGSDVSVRLFAPIDGQKELCGTLAANNENEIVITTQGKEMTIQKRQISLAKLSFKF